MITCNKHTFSFILIAVLSVLITTNTFCQDTIPNLVPKIEISGYAGGFLKHRDTMDVMGNPSYWGTDVRVGFQTTGNRYWQELFNYPYYGIGFYSGHFKNNKIGNPIAIYAFMELPFIRREKLTVSTSWGVGGCFHVNEYDSVYNKDNVAIGTDANVYIDFCLFLKYKFAPRWEIGTGFKFQHYSNGALKQPNLGLNMLSGQATLSFYPGKTIDEYKKGAKPELYKKWEFQGMFGYGRNGNSKYVTNQRYENYTISIGANRRMNYKRTLGFGFDFFYNEYLCNVYWKHLDEMEFKDLASYALYLGSDLIANKFRITTQLGVYVFRPVNYGLFFYERIGLRYYLLDHLFLNFTVKAHGIKAQNVEWGIGFSI